MIWYDCGSDFIWEICSRSTYCTEPFSPTEIIWSVVCKTLAIYSQVLLDVCLTVTYSLPFQFTFHRGKEPQTSYFKYLFIRLDSTAFIQHHLHKFSRYVLYTITKPWHGFYTQNENQDWFTSIFFPLYTICHTWFCLFHFVQLLEQVL